jgi:hypothetical protein
LKSLWSRSKWGLSGIVLNMVKLMRGRRLCRCIPLGRIDVGRDGDDYDGGKFLLGDEFFMKNIKLTQTKPKLHTTKTRCISV